MRQARLGITQPIYPIRLAGGPYGVLLLHGFTATPHCFKFLAEQLHRAKFTVSAPLLAGHGTYAEDLEETSWDDWYQSTEDAYFGLRKRCETIFVVGFSMGGLLALHLAHHHPQIKALGLLATPIFLDSWLVRFLFPLIWKTPLRYLYRYQKKFIVSIKDPLERRRHQTYGKIPVASVANLLDLQQKVRKELGFIRHPTLIAHALDDATVPYGNLDYIQSCLGSEEIKTLTLKRSSHVITVDYDKEIVARHLVKFFKRYL